MTLLYKPPCVHMRFFGVYVKNWNRGVTGMWSLSFQGTTRCSETQLSSLRTHWQCGVPAFPHPRPCLTYRFIFFLIFASWIWDNFLCFHLHFPYFAEVNSLFTTLLVKLLAFPQLSSSTKDTWPKSERLTASPGGINFCERSKLLTFFSNGFAVSVLVDWFETLLFHLLNMSLCLFLDSQLY